MGKSESDRFYFIANNLALDFANTLIVDENGDPLDLVKSLDELVDWSQAAGIVSADLAREIKSRPNRGQFADLFKHAMTFRGELKKMANAVSSGKRVPNSTIDAINEALSLSSGHFELSSTKDGYATIFKADAERTPAILVSVAQSAAKLLSEGDLGLVRKCQREACVLYFYDTSKRHGRQWCSMSVCGNRAKAASHYKRLRSS